MKRETKPGVRPTDTSAVVRQGRAQRNRINTRGKLVKAAEIIIAGKGVDATTISDITNQADVATGSFYNHFSSKTEIAEAVFAAHADEVARITDRIFEAEDNPALAVANIQKFFLTRVLTDPVWGWFVVHTSGDMPQAAEAFLSTATRHVQRGIELGQFHTDSVPVALKIILVSLLAGMRDILEEKASRDMPVRMVQALLQMLGVPIDEARALAKKRLPAHVGRMFRTVEPG